MPDDSKEVDGSGEVSRRGVLKGTTASATGFVLGTSVLGASGRVSPPEDAPRDAPGAVFRVGAARRSIDPLDESQATHIGGYGTCEDCPTTDVRDGDQVSASAFVVADEARENLVAVAVVDVQGWFAGYQDWDLGIRDLREDVAATLSRPREAGGAGVDVAPGDVIVQATHDHAGADIVGIWGDVNPNYLERVYAQTRDAIVSAARDLTPSVLEIGTADASAPVSATRDEGNSYEGWPKDEQLSVVRARRARTGNDRPGTGRTVATYVQMPLHVNIIDGSHVGELASGYFGPAARWLDAAWGGTTVVGPATLGDQVSPMQNDNHRLPDGTFRSYRIVDRLGALVGNLAVDGIREGGRIVEDGTVDSADQYVTFPVTNAALIAASCAHEASEATTGVTIDRACTPPYAYAGAAGGTWITALRIGDSVVASEPGEAFPQVTEAIRGTFRDAETVLVAGQAQDQLGYYYPAWVTPFTQVYSVNHLTFNTSTVLADENVAAHTANSEALGFGGEPQTMPPVDVDPCRAHEAGVQVIVYPNARDEPVPDVEGVPVPVGVYPEDARHHGELPEDVGGESAGRPIVDFGDGTVEEFPPTQGAGSYRYHAFPEPGTYEVTARLPDADAEWTQTVTVEDAHHLVEAASYPDATCKTVEEEP